MMQFEASTIAILETMPGSLTFYPMVEIERMLFDQCACGPLIKKEARMIHNAHEVNTCVQRHWARYPSVLD